MMNFMKCRLGQKRLGASQTFGVAFSVACTSTSFICISSISNDGIQYKRAQKQLKSVFFIPPAWF